MIYVCMTDVKSRLLTQSLYTDRGSTQKEEVLSLSLVRVVNTQA